VATLFTTEVNNQCGQLKKAHPGSEYMNTASATPDQKRTYTTTGVYMHKHKSKGVRCGNAVCVVLLWWLTHEQEHCVQPGGSMEGKACWGQKYRKSKEILQPQALRAKLIPLALFVRQRHLLQPLNWVIIRTYPLLWSRSLNMMQSIPTLHNERKGSEWK
jgi:hypothetical protein